MSISVVAVDWRRNEPSLSLLDSDLVEVVSVPIWVLAVVDRSELEDAEGGAAGAAHTGAAAGVKSGLDVLSSREEEGGGDDGRPRNDVTHAETPSIAILHKVVLVGRCLVPNQTSSTWGAEWRRMTDRAHTKTDKRWTLVGRRKCVSVWRQVHHHVGAAEETTRRPSPTTFDMNRRRPFYIGICGEDNAAPFKLYETSRTSGSNEASECPTGNLP
ncbi:hypothetical protein F4860DRAFT_515144 [Xylaria cubensis]|nr:hypothetical protein F4860DRAFT_515144 [Xylaria cubensis]